MKKALVFLGSTLVVSAFGVAPAFAQTVSNGESAWLSGMQSATGTVQQYTTGITQAQTAYSASNPSSPFAFQTQGAGVTQASDSVSVGPASQSASITNGFQYQAQFSVGNNISQWQFSGAPLN